MLKPSDFNISGEPIPEKVADKIFLHHIRPLNRIETIYPELELTISQKSGYRSVIWEKRKGRKGDSQHTFEYKGAADITCSNFSDNIETLLNALIDHTDYSRIAIYRSFIHCDYKNEEVGKRWVYNSNWEKLYEIE